MLYIICLYKDPVLRGLDPPKMMSPLQHCCQACSTDRLYEIAGFRQLSRVTSDSKLFLPGGRLFVCERCGTVQKIADLEWLREIVVYLAFVREVSSVISNRLSNLLVKFAAPPARTA